MGKEAKVYQRIGEFVVCFQWIENKLRDIGWFIIDPEKKVWPPKGLRNVTNEMLINKVSGLFEVALQQCKLDKNLESEIASSFNKVTKDLHQLRKDRNRILHSAFVEFMAGGKLQAIVRSNARLGMNDETGEPSYDQEILTPELFELKMKEMGEIALLLNRVHVQLIHRYPNRNRDNVG